MIISAWLNFIGFLTCVSDLLILVYIKLTFVYILIYIKYKNMSTQIYYMEERHRLLLVKQNPWWQGGQEELPAFERDLMGELMRYLERKQIIALAGLRRTGKTVLLKQIISKLKTKPNNKCYISFDDVEFQDYRLAGDLVNYFLEFSDKAGVRYLFLDEAQKLPNWQDLLKVLYDTESKLKVFVSGSSGLDLGSSKETLAGRILTFHLPVMSFAEFARYSGLKANVGAGKIEREYDLHFGQQKARYMEAFVSYLQRGGFPELAGAADEEFVKKYIRESVVEKVAADIAKSSSAPQKTIFDMMRMLSASNAQLVEVVNLAKALGISRITATKYLGMLEKSFFTRLAYNYTPSVAKQVRQSKKQYVAHSSIAMAMLDYPFSSLRTTAAGLLVEGVVANSVNNPFFWRSAQKDEVDIVSKSGMPVEVKYTTDISTSDTRPILKFCAKYGRSEAVVVTKDIFETRRYGNIKITFVPAWFFLLSAGKLMK